MVYSYHEWLACLLLGNRNRFGFHRAIKYRRTILFLLMANFVRQSRFGGTDCTLGVDFGFILDKLSFWLPSAIISRSLRQPYLNWVGVVKRWSLEVKWYFCRVHKCIFLIFMSFVFLFFNLIPRQKNKKQILSLYSQRRFESGLNKKKSDHNWAKLSAFVVFWLYAWLNFNDLSNHDISLCYLIRLPTLRIQYWQGSDTVMVG